MWGELIASARLPGISGISLDEDPIEFVLAHQTAVGASHGVGVSEALGAALVRVAEGSTPFLRTTEILAAEVESIAIIKAKIDQIAEELCFFLARYERNIKTR